MITDFLTMIIFLQYDIFQTLIHNLYNFLRYFINVDLYWDFVILFCQILPFLLLLVLSMPTEYLMKIDQEIYVWLADLKKVLLVICVYIADLVLNYFY